MPTPEKTEIINKLTQKFQESSGIYLTNYSGMNVSQATNLRDQFRKNEISYVVSKNTLTKIAVKNAGYDNIFDDLLQGQIGTVTSIKDSLAPARIIKNFNKENNNVLKVVGLYADEKF